VFPEPAEIGIVPSNWWEIESVDFAVQEAEVAHQKAAAELAEIVRSDNDAPRSGERDARHQASRTSSGRAAPALF
jgi:hypothetical protein